MNRMNRVLAAVSAVLLGLFALVPVVAAADPVKPDEHLIFNTGGDIVIPAGQHVDLLVVVKGTATIQGQADSVFLIDATADFVGSQTKDVVAIRSQVNLDDGSAVTGNVRTLDSNVKQAAGATVHGGILRDLDLNGIDLAGGAAVLGAALFLAYIGWSIALIFAALVLAGLASRQVRSAEALISRQPARSVGAAVLGLIAIVVAGVLAIVTIVGIPLGLGILVGVLPMLFIVGYVVAGIWIGERLVGPTSNGAVRERPYLAAVVGMAVLSVLSLVPFVGGLASLIGFGAVILLMWRTFRGTNRPTPDTTTAEPPAAAQAA